MLQIEEIKIGKFISTNQTHIPVFSEQTTLETVYKPILNAAIPALIQNNKGEFAGLISLKDVLYLHRSRFSTKSGNALFTPPFLTPEDTLEKGLEQMLALGLFVLPVFDPETKDPKKVLGFLDLYELLPEFKHLELTGAFQKPLLLDLDSSVKEGYEILRNNNSAQLILIDSAGRLAGMITKRSLADGLLTSVDRQKFSSKKNVQENYSFDTEQIFRIDAPIKNFVIKPEVIKNVPAILGDICDLYRDKRINLLLLVDANNKPLNVITLSSVLHQILHQKKQPQIALTINGLNDLGELQEEFQASAADYYSDLKALLDLRSLNISIKTTSTDENKIIEFEIVCEALSENGNVTIGKNNNAEAMKALRNSIDNIKTQHRRAKSQMISGKEEAVPMGRATGR